MKFSYLSRTLFGAASLAASAVSASAADLGPYKPYDPPPQPIYESAQPAIWEGAYIGANLGYGWGNTDLTSPDGINGGGQIGYNWQRDRFVFGLEADLQSADNGTTNFFGPNYASTDIDAFGTLRARAGVAAGPLLFYATGGLAFADISNEVGVASVPVVMRDDGWQTGYAVGGGIEWQFARNWTMKAEYLYMDFGDQTLSGIGGDLNTYSTDVHTDLQTARIGLNYKF